MLPLVESVRTEFAPLLPGITLDGEKLQAAAVGSPEQESATPELATPPTGATVTLNWTDLACFTVAALGLAAMEKSAPVPFRLTLGLAEVIPSVPLTVRAPRRVPNAVGVKVTLNRQEVPPRTPAAEQVLACEKSPVIPMLENWKHVLPMLLSVTDCGLLEVPGTWLPKVSVLAEKLTFAARTSS